MWIGIRVAALGLALVLASASPALAEERSEEGSEERVHDPYQGMDKSGRIPAVEKPADLPNPERWRYIPEGRLKPGNFFQRFLASSFLIPFVFRNADTGVGGGLGPLSLWRVLPGRSWRRAYCLCWGGWSRGPDAT